METMLLLTGLLLAMVDSLNGVIKDGTMSTFVDNPSTFGDLGLHEIASSLYINHSPLKKNAKGRQRRQAIGGAIEYVAPITTDLSATQHCQGIYLRWKRPLSPMSSNNFFTNSEFLHYNVYRSSRYFTNVNQMTPYASGKEHFELRNLASVYWFDKDPLTNDHVWYAVTIVTRDGKENKHVTPAKAVYFGAFGGSSIRIPITPGALKGITMNHASLYNPTRDEYFIAWDVDTNLDHKPDRVYCVRLGQSGQIVGRNILDITVNLPSAVQGWPTVAYNPIMNEYLVAFQVKKPGFFSGKPVIVGQRIRATSFVRAANPSLLLNANENRLGKLIQTSVINPKLMFNPVNNGYVLLAEVIGLGATHSIAMLHCDSQSKGISSAKIYEQDARSGRVFFDTTRKELYIVAIVPHKVINRNSDVKPKLPYAILVTKRNATGGVLGAAPKYALAGETNLLAPSLSGFYDPARDRLLLFWSDIVKGKRIIKSSRVVMDTQLSVVESMENDHEEHVCPSPVSVQYPDAAPLPTTSGQVLVWEQYQSGRTKIGSNLVKEEAFQFQGRMQKWPRIVANTKNDQVLVTWKEVIRGGQVNMFGRILKPVSHQCAFCPAPKVCKKENVCVLPAKAKNPCAANNGGCSQVCLRSYGGAKCSCRDGYQLASDKKTCIQGQTSVAYTILVCSKETIWKVAAMNDGSLKIDRMPFNGASIVAIYVDEKQSTLYWSDVDNDVIWKAKMDGTTKEVFMRNVRADGIVVDKERSKVFWTDFLNKRIETADSNKQNRKVLVSSGVEQPRAIVMCKLNGATYVYWTEWGSQSKIERIQLDGSLSNVVNRRVIVNYGLAWPNGLTVDCERNLLYWADAQYDKIESSDLMGNNRQTLAGALVVHPFSIALYENSLFWSDWEGSLYKVDQITGLGKEAVLSTIDRPTGIYIMKGKVKSTKSCKDPGVPENALRTGNDLTENSLLTFKCKKNYDLVGQSQIRCKSDGQWTDGIPFCIESRCADPPVPDGGNRVVTGSLVGDAVVYTCNPGYKLIGNQVRKCQTGGTWSGKQPACMSVPVFTEKPQSQTVPEETAVFLSCTAHGDGTVKTEWLKDGQPFNVKDERSRILVIGSSIYIKRARFSDSGIFTCAASNPAGKVTASAKLRVLGKKILECGVPKFVTKQRIAGGRVAGAGSHPWIAMMWRKSTKKVFCGGSLIARKWVLSAAHCFRSYSMADVVVKFGKVKPRKTEAHEQIRSIKAWYNQPQFDQETLDSDLILIELDKPVLITDYVIPICLPRDDSDLQLLKPGITGVIVGWGSKTLAQEVKGNTTKRLREVEIPLVDFDRCAAAMSLPVTANMFCAGDGKKGDACRGDSGGPLTVWNVKTKKHVLIGVVSWGEGCGKTDAFGVYVKVENFLPWINSYIS